MRHLATTLLLAAAAVSCAASDPHAKGSAKAEPTVDIRPAARMLDAPVTTAPSPLPGVDTSALNGRENEVYWRWVSQLYAPCSEVAVSIAECVRDARPCASCTPAAQFLADRARDGVPTNEAIAAFQVRFGADVKKVDLADSPARGPSTAPVTIVVWSDFECPACGYAVPLLDELLEKRPDDIRLVHKLYPLKLHPHARPAARAALAAKKQGKYWEMERQLFSHQHQLEEQDLMEHAKAIGLDLVKFRRDFADKANEDVIERDKAEADKQGLSGTPFILINGREANDIFFNDPEAWVKLDMELAGQTPKPAAGKASADPSSAPTAEPTASATAAPSGAPSAGPSTSATAAPSGSPTAAPKK